MENAGHGVSPFLRHGGAKAVHGLKIALNSGLDHLKSQSFSVIAQICPSGADTNGGPGAGVIGCDNTVNTLLMVHLDHAQRKELLEMMLDGGR